MGKVRIISLYVCAAHDATSSVRNTLPGDEHMDQADIVKRSFGVRPRRRKRSEASWFRHQEDLARPVA